MPTRALPLARRRFFPGYDVVAVTSERRCYRPNFAQDTITVRLWPTAAGGEVAGPVRSVYNPARFFAARRKPGSSIFAPAPLSSGNAPRISYAASSSPSVPARPSATASRAEGRSPPEKSTRVARPDFRRFKYQAYCRGSSSGDAESSKEQKRKQPFAIAARSQKSRLFLRSRDSKQRSIRSFSRNRADLFASIDLVLNMILAFS